MLRFAMLPVVLTGVSLTLAERDGYPVYAVCGRFLPIPAVADQQLRAESASAGEPISDTVPMRDAV